MEKNILQVNVANENDIKKRINIYSIKPVNVNAIDLIVKYAMTDGIGTAWTDTEKTGAWSRLSSIKTAMDEVAVAGAKYFLGELTELFITLPDDALLGQEISIVFSSGKTPCTLYVELEGFDFVPSANKTHEILFTYIGVDWLVKARESV